MSINEVLLTAKNLIRNPRNWTKGQSQRYLGDGTTAYCITGACRQAAVDLGVGQWVVLDAINAAAERRSGFEAVSLNDAEDTTHDQVLAVIDDAIAWERSQS